MIRIKNIDKQELRRIIYHIRHDYLTVNNLVIALALMVALSWAWGSVEAMQRNYALQRSLDSKKQQLEVEKLRVSLAEYETRYYETAEYQDLTIRQRLGYASPGEKQLIVPSTDTGSTTETPQNTANIPQESNFQQWMNFLFGGRRR